MSQFTKEECLIINEALASHRGHLSVSFREAVESGNSLRAEAFKRVIRDTQTAQRKLSYRVDYRSNRISGKFTKRRRPMPNPSALQAEKDEQLAVHLRKACDTYLSKALREQHLSMARELAEELGIKLPDYNSNAFGAFVHGERYQTSDELETERDQLLARIAEIDAEFEDRADQRAKSQ